VRGRLAILKKENRFDAVLASWKAHLKLIRNVLRKEAAPMKFLHQQAKKKLLFA
jgi:hypothetical protein